MKFIACLAFLIVSALADVSHLANKGEPIAILKQSADIGTDGHYSWLYETANGIAAQEQGSLKSGGPDGIQEARGSASWTAPDGQQIQLTYIADENGYQPQGSHLPVPPPIPEAILKSLEYIKNHPQPQEQSQSFQPKQPSFQPQFGK